MHATRIDLRNRLGFGLTAVLAITLTSSFAWAQAGGGPPDNKADDKAADKSADKPAAGADATPPDKAPAGDSQANPSGAGSTDGNPAAGGASDVPKPPLQPIGSLGVEEGAEPAAGTAQPEAAPPAPSDTTTMPVNLRLRRLEQRVQALKERAWRAKARVGMLKEAVLGGGVGATATVMHKNKMGSSFRLIKLIYALDGTQVFARSDDTGALHKQKEFEVLTGPIAPGSHTVSVLAIYRGHGYGVFKYLTKYKFTVRSSHTFTATEGKNTRILAVGFEKGGVTTPLEDRPALDFKVSHARGAGEN